MYNLQSWDGGEGGKSVFDLPNFPPGHSIPNLIRFESRILLSKDLFIFLIRSLFSENFKKKMKKVTDQIPGSKDFQSSARFISLLSRLVNRIDCWRVIATRDSEVTELNRQRMMTEKSAPRKIDSARSIFNLQILRLLVAGNLRHGVRLEIHFGPSFLMNGTR